MRPPVWLHALSVDHECDGCTADIDAGDPAALLDDGTEDGQLLCLDCGCIAEDEAEEVAS